MKIIYIAKHEQIGTSNDDEGAIAYALRSLGHEVLCVRQDQCSLEFARNLDGDCALIHHWSNLTLIEQINIPTFFWCFDLIDYSVKGRTTAWVNGLLKTCCLGFLTDGNYVRQRANSRLRWLCQGFDTRQESIKQDPNGSILMTALLHHGKRIELCRRLEKRYGKKFVHSRTGLYGRELAEKIAQSSIVVAPDFPHLSHYWSNRVYLSSGYGGLVAHPQCEGLETQYQDGESILYYRNWDELFSLIDRVLDDPDYGKRIRQNAETTTRANQSYLVRCRELAQQIEQALL